MTLTGAYSWLLARKPFGRWMSLLGLSLTLTSMLFTLKLPAALLIGPMVAAIALSSLEMGVLVPRPLFLGAQGIVGVMIAGNLPSSIFMEIGADWPIFLTGTLSTVLAASVLGWLLARSKLLPGTTAIWGSSPGAATAMTLMSSSYGADMRLVAFMQYTRLVCCTLAATMMAKFLGTPILAQSVDWQGSNVTWLSIVFALVVAFSGVFIGVGLKLPGGGLLLPLVLGVAVKWFWHIPLALPQMILAFSYGFIGWSIGMRFSKSVLVHAAKALPAVLASILTLIAICGGLAELLVKMADVDLLTAFLATSPGGADSVAIIAVATKVNVPFVMAMQVARFVLVVVTGPILAKLLSKAA